jgi:hypothetical protein
MNEAFRAKIEAKLAAYSEWSAGRKFSACRLVRYVGVDMVGAQDLPLTEVP